MNILNVRWRGRLDLFDNMPKDCRNETTLIVLVENDFTVKVM